MLIAFEGPDNTGKSTSAQLLDSGQTPEYSLVKHAYDVFVKREATEKGLVRTFDRIDWLTHMVYRLALPGQDWNDDRPRTVFAMPETHLVFKVHHVNAVPDRDDEEGYSPGMPSSVNDMYRHWAYMLMQLNEVRNYSLFKTVTIMEVSNNFDPEHAGFYQRIVDFSSPVFPWGTQESKLVHDENSLLDLLLREEQHRL